ncbi:PEP-CTERM sorting domain-containing protein [Paucibacter sp. TC2R-5]|uniref:PEP-CTERM sorting domain-containing protein n=1 Tax=Paucibacter sp. TC2R-5 TaxID=2893555 RepID=UPI0021E3E026|nr:PEP-CTERM sorting domain-containing protein [Paucibacter sp. TC2R-5]MCV2361621.1 PEP-CTERM sorting domain-containing protein [Paucibacter sp. TC2R-5]
MMIKAKYLRGLAIATLVCAGMSQQIALAKELTVDVSNIASNDERDAASNITLDFYVGARASMDSLKWDVSVTSYAGSYLSEMQITFSDTLGNGVTFAPGGGDDFDGPMAYAGFQDLRLNGTSFQVGSDGILRLEFHEYYKDLAYDEPDGIWNSGTLTFGVTPVPEPQTYALMLGGLLLILRAAKRRGA